MGRSAAVLPAPSRTRRAALACSALLACLSTAPVFAQNFHDLVNRKFCDSVIGSLRGKCESLNASKESICAVGGRCEFDKHQAQIAEYKAAIAQRDSGAIAAADMDALKDKIARMKDELDKRRDEAEKNEKAARACADARQEVYDFFDDVVIPETEKAGSAAEDRREDLLEALETARTKQRDAKDKRDRLEGADPEKDRTRWDEFVKAREEYEASATTSRDAEAALAEFNQVHGADIEDAVRKLVNYYKEQQGGHKDAIEQEKNRSESCGKLEYLSY